MSRFRHGQVPGEFRHRVDQHLCWSGVRFHLVSLLLLPWFVLSCFGAGMESTMRLECQIYLCFNHVTFLFVSYDILYERKWLYNMVYVVPRIVQWRTHVCVPSERKRGMYVFLRRRWRRPLGCVSPGWHTLVQLQWQRPQSVNMVSSGSKIRAGYATCTSWDSIHDMTSKCVTDLFNSTMHAFLTEHISNLVDCFFIGTC